MERVMSAKTQEITEMLAPVVAAMGLELLGIEFVPARAHGLLRLYIDVAGQVRPVTVEDCEAVSREVSGILDVNDPITSAYTLEVSSPGIDRLLFTAGQMGRFIGESVKVQLALPQDGRRRVQGKLLRMEGDTAVVALENGAEFAVAFDNIEKARLVPDYVALGIDVAWPSKAPRQRRKDKKAAAPAAEATDSDNH
jgi:ribosome maturation factor RimP